MVDANGTSFIPKQSKNTPKPRTSRRIYIFSYISYVLFFGTLLAVLGVYLYAQQINHALAEQQDLLEGERTSYSEGDIAQVRDMEKRLIMVEQLLLEASAPSRIFNALESVIASTVYVRSFLYERAANSNFTVAFTIGTEDFDSAVFQQELLSKTSVLGEPVITEYTYGEATGEEQASNETAQLDDQLVVTFESTASTALIPYEAASAAESSVPTPELQPVPATSTAPAEATLEQSTTTTESVSGSGAASGGLPPFPTATGTSEINE